MTLTKVLDTAQRCTEVMQLNKDNPAIDFLLLHLWEAIRALLKRWKRQKLKKLWKRIFFIDRRVETVCRIASETQLVRLLR